MSEPSVGVGGRPAKNVLTSWVAMVRPPSLAAVRARTGQGLFVPASSVSEFGDKVDSTPTRPHLRPTWNLDWTSGFVVPQQCGLFGRPTSHKSWLKDSGGPILGIMWSLGDVANDVKQGSWRRRREIPRPKGLTCPTQSPSGHPSAVPRVWWRCASQRRGLEDGVA